MDVPYVDAGSVTVAMGDHTIRSLYLGREQVTFDPPIDLRASTTPCGPELADHFNRELLGSCLVRCKACGVVWWNFLRRMP